MTTEQIQNAAEEARLDTAISLTPLGSHHYIDDIPFINEKLSYDEVAESAFIKGANWRINSVWHTEEPKIGSVLCIIKLSEEDYSIGYSVTSEGEFKYFDGIFGAGIITMDHVKSWVYIYDILPIYK